MAELRSLPFHRKHRPKNYEGYIGNEKAIKDIRNMFISGTYYQTMLFIGDSGCGKTSLARLVGTEYRCENPDPYKGACGVCPSCLAMQHYIETGETGELFYFKEADASQEGGKRDIDSMLQDISIPAPFGMWKIYIIDECHLLTEGAQSSFLKVLEEPPERVAFFFATTDPDKLKDTIRNRFQLELKISKPTVKQLVDLLRNVCIKEGAEFDARGLALIAHRSGLTIRSSLTKLQNVLTSQSNKATYSCVVNALEEVDEHLLFDFLKYLIHGNTLQYIKLLYEIKCKINMNTFLRNLIEFVSRGIYILNGAEIEGMTDGELKKYTDLFTQFTAEQISVLIEKLVNMRGDVETKLMLMGYTGLKSNIITPNGNIPKAESMDNELDKEHKASLQSAKDNFTPTQEAIEEAIQEQTKERSFDDIMGMFGVNLVNK